MEDFMFLFRPITDPVPPCWKPGTHWFCELHAADPNVPFPLGIAFVNARPTFATIDYLMVPDSFRANGIERRLIDACRDKWPGIHLGKEPSPALPRRV
jgi:hypothetical protein